MKKAKSKSKKGQPMSDSEIYESYRLLYADLDLPKEHKEALLNVECRPKPQWLRGNIRYILERILISTEDDGFSYQDKKEISEFLHLSERTFERSLKVLTQKNVVQYHKSDEVYEVKCGNLQSVLAQAAAA